MIQIIFGILALGVVIFIHELGHFLAARLCGVTVETFSIGWGPVLLKKKYGNTEYRLSALPIGGYCGMKGKHAFREALDKGLSAIPSEPGSFYGASAAKRIWISFAGPLANLLFAVLALTVVSATGYSYNTHGNKIIPSSVYTQERTPADDAGLMAGDRILFIDSQKTETWADIQQTIAVNAGKELTIMFERNGATQTTRVIPSLDKKTGGGRIGIYPWVPLTIASIKPGSAAETAGLRDKDEIIAVNGATVSNYMEFLTALSAKPEQVTVRIQRNNLVIDYLLVLLYPDDGRDIETGIVWDTVSITVPGTGFPGSLVVGTRETVKLIALTFKSIGLLFKGVDLGEAVSGPVRITLMIGEVASTNMSGLGELIAIICVSLFLMNLLPVPVLDGGQIILAAIELVIRKQIKPKILYNAQLVGMALIMTVFLLALFSDIRFLFR